MGHVTVAVIGILALWYICARWSRHSLRRRAVLRVMGSVLFLPAAFIASVTVGIVLSAWAEQLGVTPDGIGGAAAKSSDLRVVMAAAINAIGVLVVVQLVKRWWPQLRQAVPWVLPILTPVIGPALAVGQNWIAGQLGLAIDLSPILAAVTAPMAVAANQVYKQARS